MESVVMENNKKAPQSYNLHTHTFRSKHASGDASEYAAVATAAGAEMLGFTEHPPLLPNEIWTPFRMAETELDDYFSAVEKARKEYREMKILTGFEMDLYPKFKSYYDDTFLHRDEIDFLVAGVHWINYRGEWLWIQKADTAGHLREYVNEITGLMESGLFSFITHPDSFALGYLKWDENAEACSHVILCAAEEFKIPLEINGYGLRKADIDTPDGPRKGYPLNKFWEKARNYDISVVCNSDAHKPEDAMGGLEGCHEIIKKYGLVHHPIQQELLKTSSGDTVRNQPTPSVSP